MLHRFVMVPVAEAPNCPFYARDESGKNRCFWKDQVSPVAIQSLVVGAEKQPRPSFRNDCRGEYERCAFTPLLYEFSTTEDEVSEDAPVADEEEFGDGSEGDGESAPGDDTPEDGEGGDASATHGVAPLDGEIEDYDPFAEESDFDEEDESESEDDEADEGDEGDEADWEEEGENEADFEDEDVLNDSDDQDFEDEDEGDESAANSPLDFRSEASVNVYQVRNPYLVKDLDALVRPINTLLTLDDPTLDYLSQGEVQRELDEADRPVRMGGIVVTTNGGKPARRKPVRGESQNPGVTTPVLLHAVVSAYRRLVQPRAVRRAVKAALARADELGMETIGFLPFDYGTHDIAATALHQMEAIAGFLRKNETASLRNIYLLVDDVRIGDYNDYFDRIFT